MMLTETVTRPRDPMEKEVLVQTSQGDVLAVKVSRNETLQSFKKRLQLMLPFPLDQSHIEFGSTTVPLSENVEFQDETGVPLSPQLRASGRLRDFPHGAHVLLKQESSGSHHRSYSSPSLDSLPSHLLEEGFASTKTCASIDASMSMCSLGAGESFREGEAHPAASMRGVHVGGDDACLSGSSADTRGSLPSSPQHRRPGFTLLPSYGMNAKLRSLETEIRKGLEAGFDPVAMADGLGGCYLFKSGSDRDIAIVKPTDEEPLAPNNPKGFVGRQLGDPGLKPTVRVGEAALRETAAYLLDHGGFSGVPSTCLAKVSHPALNYNGQGARRARTKIASVQEFVDHQFEASDVGTSLFPTEAVHRIGILDIRLFNTDRHSGNILVCRKGSGSRSGRKGGMKHAQSQSSLASPEAFAKPGVRLVPIDHGFCLPETLETAYFEWLHWPQASMPFTDEEVEYISCLDPKADVALLQRELPQLRVECLRTLEVSTTLLKRCAQAGLNLAEIGSVMSRPLSSINDEPSELERLCVLAKQEVVFSASVHLYRPGGSGSDTPEGSQGSDGESGEDHPSMFEMDDIFSPVGAAGQLELAHTPALPLAHYPDSSGSSTGVAFSTGSPRTPPSGRSVESRYADSYGSGEDAGLTRRASDCRGLQAIRMAYGAGSVVHRTAHLDRYAQSKGLVGAPGRERSKAAGDRPGGCKPLTCDMPSEEVKNLFGDMDSRAWASFLHVLFEEVADDLKCEHWRHSSNGAGAKKMLPFGTSCPGF